MASPSPPHEGDAAGEVVCCMCGDHGLPLELFRCRSCRVRLQHSYCSDLYPRATAYRRCNWCLREPARGGGPGRAAAAHGHSSISKPAEALMKRRTASGSDEERERRSSEGRCSRRAAPEPGHPVKKKHRADDDRAPPGAGKGSGTGGGGDSTELMRAGKTTTPRGVRVKVRRYKLLAEVISC